MYIWQIFKIYIETKTTQDTVDFNLVFLKLIFQTEIDKRPPADKQEEVKNQISHQIDIYSHIADCNSHSVDTNGHHNDQRRLPADRKSDGSGKRSGEVKEDGGEGRAGCILNSTGSGEESTDSTSDLPQVNQGQVIKNLRIYHTNRRCSVLKTQGIFKV